MAEVKICGNRRREDIEFAAGADYLGFIVEVADSPRSLSIADATPLVRQAAGNAQTVAVVKSTEKEFLSNVCSSLETDYIQIQLEVEPETLLEVKEELGVQVIGLVVATDGAETRAKALAEVADIILLDSAGPGGAGGTGITHDWSLSRSVRDAIYPAMFMLAGGLTPSNVASAISAVNPWAVDVASGVEEGGFKSKELVAAFIASAKGGTNA